MINYELAKRLKDAGFPIHKCRSVNDEDTLCGLCEQSITPTLSELIEACGDGFGFLLLNQENKMWLARVKGIEPIHPEFSGHRHFNTPEEAVANLWLKLNEKL